MKLKLFWIRHAESISNLYNFQFNVHPFLTHKGLLQSLDLGKNLSGIKINTVYCSPFIRTILTSLISISIYNLENENKINQIKIIPHISEINPIIYYLSNNKYSEKIQKITSKYNNQNNILDYNNIYLLSKKCIKWLNSNIISFLLKDDLILLLQKNNIKQEIIDKINKNINDKKIKKFLFKTFKLENIKINKEINDILNFKLDFNLLDFSFIKNNNLNKYDIYNYLYDNYKENNINNNDIIILFSHKNYINNIAQNNLNLNNCDMYKENIYFNNGKINKITKNVKKFNNYKKINYEKNKIILNTIQNKINNIINLIN